MNRHDGGFRGDVGAAISRGVEHEGVELAPHHVPRPMETGIGRLGEEERPRGAAGGEELDSHLSRESSVHLIDKPESREGQVTGRDEGLSHLESREGLRLE